MEYICEIFDTLNNVLDEETKPVLDDALKKILNHLNNKNKIMYKSLMEDIEEINIVL